MEIIRERTMLRSFEFGKVHIGSILLDNGLNNQVDNIGRERLESLCLTDVVLRGDDSVQDANLVFKFILQSCPNLKCFKLYNFDIGDYSEGAINLDFRENHSLRFVELNMPKCEYYTFHHEFGKYWRDVDDQIRQGDVLRASFCCWIVHDVHIFP